MLVQHLDDCRAHADEVLFYWRVRNQVAKTLPGKRPGRDLEQAVRDLVDDHVELEGVVDIFKLAGIETPDVSVLDEKFLQTFKDRPLLIHDVVQSIKNDLKVDWTEPHREDVKAGVRAAVKMVLRRRGVKPEDFAPIVSSVMEQAEALYADWPQAA